MSESLLLNGVELHNVSEGVNARTYRLVGTGKYRDLDPFVIVDHFWVEQNGGFPDHPHRGFQLLTFCLSGILRHQDSTGVSIELHPGDIQCLHTGRGLVHSILPLSTQAEALVIWVNLPSHLRMTPPSCTFLSASCLPMLTISAGCHVTVLAGSFMDVKSAISTVAETVMLEVRLEARCTSQVQVPKGMNGLIYVLQGDVWLDNVCLRQSQAGCFNTTERPLSLGSVTGCRLVLLLGKPIGEPIIQQGPFVVTQLGEAMVCLRDFNLERNGFEGCGSWRSESAYF